MSLSKLKFWLTTANILVVVILSSILFGFLMLLDKKIEKDMKNIMVQTSIIPNIIALNQRTKTMVQEWKNVLIRGSKSSDLEKYVNAIKSEHVEAGKELEGLKSKLSGEKLLIAEEYARKELELYEAYIRASNILQAEGPWIEKMAKADSSVKGKDRSVLDPLEKLTETIVQDAQLIQESAQKDIDRTIRFALVIAAIVSFVAYFISGFFARTLSKTSKEISAQADSTSLVIQSASQRIDELVQKLNLDIHSNAEALEELVTTMDEYRKVIQTEVERIQRVTDQAQSSCLVAQSGLDKANGLATFIADLQTEGKKMGAIVETIDSIAFQTNILALNAAVEAARAAESGKGFTVVAAAVRDLAGRSAQSAKAIQAMISSNDSMAVQASDRASAVSTSIQDMGHCFEETAKNVRTVASQIRTQVDGFTQVSQALNEISASTQRGATISDDLSTLVEQLRTSSLELENLQKKVA